MNSLPSAGADHLRRRTNRFIPTNQNLFAHMCFALGLGKGEKKKTEPDKCLNCFLLYCCSKEKKKKNNTKYFCLFFSSFKHMIGCLEDVSCKGNEDADAKAK